MMNREGQFSMIFQYTVDDEIGLKIGPSCDRIRPIDGIAVTQITFLNERKLGCLSQSFDMVFFYFFNIHLKFKPTRILRAFRDEHPLVTHATCD